MTIELQTRSVATPAKTGIQPIPSGPQGDRRVGIEKQRLGQTLQAVGGQFAGLIDKIERAQIRGEVADVEIAYQKAQDDFLIEQQKDLDFKGRADKAVFWHEETLSTLSEGKTQEAQSYLKRWGDQQKVKLHTSVTLNAGKLTAQNDNALLDGLLDIGVKTGDFSMASLHAEAMIDDGNKLPAVWENQLTAAMEAHEKVSHKQAYDMAYNTLLSVLDGGGMDGVEEWLAEPDNIEGLKPEDKRSLRQQMILEDMFAVIRADKISTAQTDETVSSVLESRLKGDMVKRNLIDTLEDPKTKKRLTAVQKKQSFVPDNKVDWSAVVALQDDVLSYLMEDPKMTKREIELRLTEASSSKQQLSERELSKLNEMLQLNLAPDELAILKEGFDTIKKQGARWYGTDEEKIALSRRGILSWHTGRKSRKKETTAGDAYIKAVELGTVATLPDVAEGPILEAARKSLLAEKIKDVPPPMKGKITSWEKFPDEVREKIWQAYENGWDPNEIAEAVEPKK